MRLPPVEYATRIPQDYCVSQVSTAFSLEYGKAYANLDLLRKIEKHFRSRLKLCDCQLNKMVSLFALAACLWTDKALLQ